MSCTGTCWLLDAALFQCRYGDFWVSSCLLIFPGIRSSLMFSSFGVKPPAFGSQSYSYSSLKTHFEENGLPFWVPGVCHQCSEVVSWKLFSIQMIF